MSEITLNETLGLVIVSIGVLFDIFGCIGLVRLPDVYNRLQSATKCVTVGTSFVVLGSVIAIGSVTAVIKGLICVALVLITSPTAAHALARAAYRSGVALCPQTIVDQYADDLEAQQRTEEQT